MRAATDGCELGDTFRRGREIVDFACACLALRMFPRALEVGIRDLGAEVGIPPTASERVIDDIEALFDAHAAARREGS